MSKSALYVVATPIGNLEDISLRALRILAEVDVIAAEDTRHTARLLKHYDIGTPLLAVHEHNEDKLTSALLKRIGQGQSMALVSDAGTPLISDPGFRLVRAARQQAVPVMTVPGASALTAALSVAGIASDRFVFEGFLSSRPAARRSRLKRLAPETRTLALFESSHRIEATMNDLVELFGAGREVALCRELTKQFETVITGTLGDVCTAVCADPNQRKGEFVLLVAGAELSENEQLNEAIGMAQALMEYLPLSQASRVAAKLTGAKRKDVYNAVQT